MTNLKTWLRRQPQPVAVLADDTRVEVPDTPRKWADLEETLATLAPSKLVALDAKGATLRAVQLTENEAPAAKPATPLQSDLQVLSALLAQAYKCGAETATNALSASTKANTELVTLVTGRLNALEVAWQKTLQSNAKLITELGQAGAGGDGGDLALLAHLAPLLAPLLGGNVPPTPPNGAKS
jgi:hypothetical protein